MVTWDAWRRQARRIDSGGLGVAIYDLGGPDVAPDAPTVTFCHGYPSASLDVAEVADLLAASATPVRVIALDMPGFGASDKPPPERGHTYSIHAAADAVEALWAATGTTATLLAAHDYSVSVGQELLARRAEGAIAGGTELTGVVWMNGGLYPDLHRPTPGQQALLDLEHGRELAAAVDEGAFIGGLRPTWGDRRPFDEAVAGEIFRSMDDGGGVALMHDLLHYVADRQANVTRWTGALEQADVPMTFVWGLLDPVSGGHVVPRLIDHVPQGRIVALDDVGHWPPLEAPDVVAAEIAALL